MESIKLFINGKGYDPDEIVDRSPVSVECWYDRHYRHWVIYPVDSEGCQTEEARYAFSKAEARAIKEDLENEISSKLVLASYEQFKEGRAF